MIDKQFQELTVAQEKFAAGDSITDKELASLIKYYSKMDDTLRSCRMPRYSVIADDVARKLHSLKGFDQSRRERRK